MHDTDGWLYYTYDSIGNLTTVKDAETGTFTSDYDALNRLVTKRTLAGNTYAQYDRSGKRTSFVGPSGETAYHTYDSDGRLTQVILKDIAAGSGTTRFTYYSYDASDRRASKIGSANAVMAYYAYDNAGRLSTLNNVDQSFTTISSFSYRRDANGNVTTITRESTCPAGHNVYYTYDALDRPTIEEHKTATTVFYGYLYNYDAASNRYFRHDEVAAKATYWTYDARNMLIREDAQ